jgi:hypothetical protein
MYSFLVTFQSVVLIMPVYHLHFGYFMTKEMVLFDHGFTLHYFSLLLLILTLFLIDKGMLLFDRLLQWNGLILA